MSNTIIKSCVCKHEYQDEKYGKGNRVHNQQMAKGRGVGWACTVCSKESGLSGLEEKENKAKEDAKDAKDTKK